ncbi:protein kinase family protein [Streptomyces polygonati]|uniref:Protein kinase family protein n=1 Tax=Streptomyces polygonati TaxID=1617087 RepID=A0ABV8HQ99_9ACTN
MADRSTAAVGVANEGGETQPAAQLSGATTGGTTTDDQTDGTPDGGAAEAAAQEQPTTTMPTADDPAATGTGKAGVPRTSAAANGAGQDLKKNTGAVDTSAPAGNPVQAPAKAPAKTAAKTGAGAAADSAGSTAVTARLQPTRTTPPELHSGHKLARRYQLAECVTRVDGFSSWRAVDEKLRRAVGIHILPADHDRARQVMAAARSAALLGDPRFVQVLDAVEENDLVYVIHEWLPDATSLADLLMAGPLEPHEAYQMASQVSQGMAAAHREGLAHLRLDPGAVLRTVSGQYRIRGLAVAAALRGLSSDGPQRQDTEAIGALLYASLTQRWPYEEDAHGLTGLPKGVGLVAPDQVRAGVHRGLSEVAMRALVNDGATASREESPCTTPEELAKAVAGIPRIRPPEQGAPVYRPTAFQQPPPAPGRTARTALNTAEALPPALPGRTGKALKWAVAVLVIVAIGLGSWQLADALQSNENRSGSTPPSGQKSGQSTTPPPVGPVKIVGAQDFDPEGDGSESHSTIDNVYDHDPNTYWQTQKYYSRPDLGGLKSGVGVILDLGAAHNVSGVKIDFIGGDTSVELMAASRNSTTMPTELADFTKVASADGTEVTLKPDAKVNSRYLLVWLTKLPPSGSEFRGKIAEMSVSG